MPCFSCKCFWEGRGRDGEYLSGGRGWCELWDQEYYRGHECREFAPKWYGGNGDSSLNGSGGCFLTSACVQHKGLPDDCAELTELRQFRDTVLSKTSEGKQLIDEYYCIAPAIVERIDRSADKDRIYDSIYQTVQNCLHAIRNKAYHEAVTQYRSMVYSLQSDQI